MLVFRICYKDSLSVLGILPGTILLILNILIKLLTCLVISFNTLWYEESEKFLQIEPTSTQNGSNICFSNSWKFSNLGS